ncbi:MAG: hypothetical protein K6B40_03665 [Firmicutes bacterium]|nr:hypothetical protein [Bacillota bacterium]
MNYTKTIREFCLQNKGDIFDVSFMKDAYFEMIPYKTLLKILNRLEEEDVISCVAKGVYLINEEGRDLDDAIIDRFISNGHGMYSEYTMFNDLEITSYQNEFIEIYTNKLSTRIKTIGKYQLTRIDIPFTPQIVSVITLLDCIEKGHSIIDANIIKLRDIIESLAQEYSDVRRDLSRVFLSFMQRTSQYRLFIRRRVLRMSVLQGGAESLTTS